MKNRTWIIGLAAALILLVGTAVLYPPLSARGGARLVGDAWAQEPGEEGVLPELGAALRLNLKQRYVRGDVLELGVGQLLVETTDGETATILITDTTRLWVPGEPLTATIDVEVGDPLLAFGKPPATDADGMVLEARLVVIASDEDLPKLLIRGSVVTTTRQTVVVQTGRGERAVTVVPRTHILSPAGEQDSLQVVQNGDLLIALGHPTRMGQWVAGIVLVSGPAKPARFGLRGEVSDLDLASGTLVVETERRGEIVMITSAETQIRIPGLNDPGLADVQEGDRIVAVGRFEAEEQTRFLARAIRVLNPESKDETP